MLLNNKIAVISGGASSRGIGFATARLFASHGARVAILDLDGAGAKRAAEELGERHLGLACNVADRDGCKTAADRVMAAFGQVDVLVNNAGITQPVKTMDITASLAGSILFIIGAASGMAWALTQSGFSHNLAASMAKVPRGAYGFLGISIVAFIVLGSVLEGIPAMVLFGPLLFPVAKALGIHEVHYAMVIILAMGIGLFAPPFGLGYYAACIIGRVSPDAAMGRIWPYLGVLLVGLLVVAAVPWISIGFLP